MRADACVRCTKPRVRGGLCAEHIALGADPVRDSDGGVDRVAEGAATRRDHVYGICACGAPMTGSPKQMSCAGCRRAAASGTERRCACGGRLPDGVRSRQKRCDPCRWRYAGYGVR